MWLQYYFNVIILLITVCNLIPDICSYLTLEYTEGIYIHTVKPVNSGHLGENDKMTTIYR